MKGGWGWDLALWDESISRVGGHFSTMLKSKNAQMIVEWNCPKLGAMLMMNSCWLVNEFSIVLKRYLENNKKKCSQLVIFIESCNLYSRFQIIKASKVWKNRFRFIFLSQLSSVLNRIYFYVEMSILIQGKKNEKCFTVLRRRNWN